MPNKDPDASSWTPGGPPAIDPTKLTTDAVNAAKSDIRREIQGLRDMMDIRVDSLDRALLVRHESQDHDITVLKELIKEEFAEVTIRFAERDLRYGQAAEAGKEAIAAALSAAKEAANKAEASFTKQLDSMTLVIASQDKAQTERIGELKERIDRGEGGTSGTHAAEVAQRAIAGQRTNIVTAVLFGFSVLLSSVGIVVSIVLHH